MQGWVGNTHADWLDFVSRRAAWDEVNFWTPSDYYARSLLPAEIPDVLPHAVEAACWPLTCQGHQRNHTGKNGPAAA